MIQLNDNILSQSPKMLDAKFGPFNSVTEALTFLTPSIRELGALSIVKIAGQATLYWFRNGISDSDYVPFSMGGNASIQQYPNFLSFPTVGQSDVIYIDLSTNISYYWDGTQYQSSTGGVEQYPNLSSFPLIGDPNIVYIAQDTSISYYWNGTTYHPTSSNISNVVTLTTDQEISGSKKINGGKLKLQGYDNLNYAILKYVEGVASGTVVFPSASGGSSKYVAYQDWASNPNNIIEDTTHRFVTDAEKTTWNSKQDSLIFSTDIETDKLSTTKISAIKTFYDWSIGKFQELKTILTTLGNLPDSLGWLKNDGNGNLSYTTLTKSDVGLGNVVNIDTTNANNITSGTLPDSRLSSNVVLSDSAQNISGAKIHTILLTTQGNNLLTTQDYTKGILLQNTTAADVTNKVQYSPALVFDSQIWGGDGSGGMNASATSPVKWKIEQRPVYSGAGGSINDNNLVFSTKLGNNSWSDIATFTKSGLTATLSQTTLNLGVTGFGSGLLNFKRSSDGSVVGYLAANASYFGVVCSGVFSTDSKVAIGGTYTTTLPLTPNNGLYVAGETVHASGILTPIISKNANYTLTSTDDTIKVTASGVTMTLPTSVGRTGREFTIINASNGDITVATTSSQLIGNYTTATTLTILSNNSYTLKSDGIGWVIKSKF